MSFRGLTTLFLLVLFFTACSSPSDRKNTNQVTIAVAASLALPIEKIAKVYEVKSNVRVTIISGSSGKLAAQIAAGAPYQLFLSADIEYPAALVAQGLTKGSVTVFASGSLALFARNSVTANGLDALTHPEITSIAIPNPAVAPYGRAAIEALKKAGLHEQLKTKFVYGESVGQVNQFLHGGVVDAGITALTFAKMEQEEYVVNRVDTSLYSPIQHGAVLLKRAGEQAEDFLAFLRSEKGQNILNTYEL